MNTEFRNLPSVEKVLNSERIRLLVGYPHDLITDVVRRRLEQERVSIVAGNKCASPDAIIDSVIGWLQQLEKPGLRRVVNASGVIIHTNLGRSPLSDATLSAMDVVSRGYANLEFDLEKGTRGSRHVHIESLLCQLTGAEAAVVVNNNASAVLLGLTALAKRKEVIVSRGQAVEIGGGFRVPDVMRQSGAKLVEVGTTNRTYVADYEQAITSRTAALMHIHTSNFLVVGFTSNVTLAELVALGKSRDIPVIDDVGSGCLLDTLQYGLSPEPTVQESVREGAALTFFSGDKLMGGPQAGIIVGRKVYIDKIKKHPLARALRIDRTRLAALVATVTHYLKGEAVVKIPIWRMIAAPLDDIEKRAKTWAQAVGPGAEVISGQTMVGGGSLPGASLPTYLVSLKSGSKTQSLGRELRLRNVPVVGRIDKDCLLLDPRTVLPEEDEIVLRALQEIASKML